MVWGTAIALVAVVPNCAYFNTLYNAKKKYEDAQKSEQRQNTPQSSQLLDDEGNVVGKRTNYTPVVAANQNVEIYQQVIEKCRKLIAHYPKSRHCDDAMLLIGKSLYAMDRYDDTVSALDSLITRYPKTNLKEEAGFLKGKALVGAKKYDDASVQLTEFVDTYRKSDDRPEALYLLCTSLMQLGLSDRAVAALERLEKDHGRSEYRYRAQTDMAGILVDKGMFKESLAIYDRLSESRIPGNVRYDVWMGMSRSQIELGEFADAMVTLDKLRTLQLTPDREAPMLLLRGRAFAGADSTERAIRVYQGVSTRFARGQFGAEADYRLGTIYERLDSLQTAQTYYQRVASGYSQSEFADDAIKRAGDIGRMLRLQAAAGDDSPEAVALRTFSMAELQFTQFKSTDKAIPAYEKIVNEFPDSEFAPKSAYALGYIYGVVLQDSVKAKEWYEVLRTRYADSQQSLLAYTFYRGAPIPPMSELMKYSGTNKAGTPPPVPEPARTVVDTTRALPPAHVPADTTRVKAAPDSVRVPVPQPVDTTAAPPDTSGHGN